MKHLNLLVLRSADIEQTRKFYEVFELRFIRHAHGAGPKHYAHEDEHGVFEIYPSATKGAPTHDMTGLGFSVTDLEQTRAQLSAFDPKPISEHEWRRTFVIRDPDGRRVEVKQACN